jgi:hypothetical protein
MNAPEPLTSTIRLHPAVRTAAGRAAVQLAQDRARNTLDDPSAFIEHDPGDSGDSDRRAGRYYADATAHAAEPGPPPNVPVKYHGLAKDLDGLDPAAVARARDWLRYARTDPAPSRGLLLLGEVGTGKSTIAGALAVEMGAPRFAQFWPVDDLFAEIKREYSTPQHDRDDVLTRIAKRRLLVLDDVGAEQPVTDWTRGTIGKLVSSRYDASQLLIITSNLAAQDFVQYLDHERIISRLHEMLVIVEVGGPDRRKALKAVRRSA